MTFIRLAISANALSAVAWYLMNTGYVVPTEIPCKITSRQSIWSVGIDSVTSCPSRHCAVSPANGPSEFVTYTCTTIGSMAWAAKRWEKKDEKE